MLTTNTVLCDVFISEPTVIRASALNSSSTVEQSRVNPRSKKVVEFTKLHGNVCFFNNKSSSHSLRRFSKERKTLEEGKD